MLRVSLELSDQHINVTIVKKVFPRAAIGKCLWLPLQLSTIYWPVYPGDNDTNIMYVLQKILRHQSPGDATHYPVPFPENAANTSTAKTIVVLLITTWHTNYLIEELHRTKGDIYHTRWTEVHSMYFIWLALRSWLWEPCLMSWQSSTSRDSHSCTTEDPHEQAKQLSSWPIGQLLKCEAHISRFTFLCSNAWTCE